MNYLIGVLEATKVWAHLGADFWNNYDYFATIPEFLSLESI